MKKEKIKALPVVEAYMSYFIRRAKKVLKLRDSEFDAFHIDLHDGNSVAVWFFVNTNVIANVQFTLDGRQGDRSNIIDKRKKKKSDGRK